MKKLSVIYQIRNLINNHRYIGQTVNFKKRRQNHFWDLAKNKHRNDHLQKAYNRYGKKSFIIEILLYCEPFELTRYEQWFVDKYSPEYNICKECVDSTKGVTHTEEYKKKQSDSHKGKPVSKETREKLRIANTGNHVVTEEHKQILREALTGRRLSEETKQKISNARKGFRMSEECKQKISKSLMGHTVSEETIMKKVETWRKKKEESERL